MIISKRNHVIARQKKMMRLLLAWAISSSISLVFVTLLCGYAMLSRPIKLVPFSGREMSISDLSYSPEYLLEYAKKVAQLRFSFSPETIKNQYRDILNLTDLKYQSSVKAKLAHEVEVVSHKEISSVFYVKESHVDASKNTAVLKGELVRASHGIRLTPSPKSFEFKFSFNGSLHLESIKELSNA